MLGSLACSCLDPITGDQGLITCNTEDYTQVWQKFKRKQISAIKKRTADYTESSKLHWSTHFLQKNQTNDNSFKDVAKSVAWNIFWKKSI